MAEIGVQLGVACPLAGAQQREGDVAVLFRREEPVAGEPDDERLGLHRGEGLLQRALAGHVEGINCPRDVQVAVRVEAIDEALTLVAQVALDLEFEAREAGRGARALSGGRPGRFVRRGFRRRRRGAGGRRDRAPPPAELAVEAGVAEVRDVRHHARDGEADARTAVTRVVAAVPARVLQDGLSPDLVEGNALSALPRGRGHGDHAPDEARVLDGPLECLHSTHGAADDRVQGRDSEGLQPPVLCPHHVPDRHAGKRDPVGAAGGRVDRSRPTGTLAAPDDVGAENEVAVRVDRLARPDQIVPPARFTVAQTVNARAVVVAAQRVANQDRVVARGVEPAIGLVAERVPRQHLA